MKLASHNTMTYLSPRKLWMKAINFTAKCQSLDINGQYAHGARLFDVRVRFDNTGAPLLAHGLVEYKGGQFAVFSALYAINKLKCPTRLLLEENAPDAKQMALFKEFCAKVQKDYQDIYFFGGTDRNGAKIYDFGNKYPRLKGAYGSDSGHKINGLYPLLYAKKHNKVSKTSSFDTDYLLLDFIEIG